MMDECEGVKGEEIQETRDLQGGIDIEDHIHNQEDKIQIINLDIKEEDPCHHQEDNLDTIMNENFRHKEIDHHQDLLGLKIMITLEEIDSTISEEDLPCPEEIHAKVIEDLRQEGHHQEEIQIVIIIAKIDLIIIEEGPFLYLTEEDIQQNMIEGHHKKERNNPEFEIDLDHNKITDMTTNNKNKDINNNDQNKIINSKINKLDKDNKKNIIINKMNNNKTNNK